jgi:hypothetical protein
LIKQGLQPLFCLKKIYFCISKKDILTASEQTPSYIPLDQYVVEMNNELQYSFSE